MTARETFLLDRKLGIGGSDIAPHHGSITVFYTFRCLQRKNESRGDL